jgi:Domain of unknown function (DUF222)
MELGDPTAVRAARSPLDVLLDKLHDNLTELIETVETGGLEHLHAAEKIGWWQRFEAFRNQLPLIDHHLIATAEATDLAGSYGFTNLSRFLVRILQLSPGEAASRVRAAAAIGPRTSMLGEHLAPVLPRLADLQREGSVSVEKVEIVERAMRRPSHPIHRGSARVVRMAAAYGGTTTPKPRKLPGSVGHQAMAARVSAVAARVACPPGICVEVGRHEFVAHRDWDQMRDSHQRQPDSGQNRRQNHHWSSQSKGVVETTSATIPRNPIRMTNQAPTKFAGFAAWRFLEPLYESPVRSLATR